MGEGPPFLFFPSFSFCCCCCFCFRFLLLEDVNISLSRAVLGELFFYLFISTVASLFRCRACGLMRLLFCCLSSSGLFF
ncbi:hypothetical protein BD289DRAFT_448808 [Coniella lustricola]|uniref:Uncharacterized protein n=1 Tax=Coniella lustricola TaxID=2025994 RepID=A0A2T2ZRU2_9PEZI|nr:hypothetical protein BD289DRAFT_448808 [Coniella lustricola]